jgi:hypothetical protein
MPTLSNQVKQSIRDAINARDPQRTKNGFILRFGNARNSGYRYLTRNNEPTPAGEFWREITGKPLPLDVFDENAPITIRGRTEYIETSNGQQALRSWDAARQRYKYTPLGRKYYKNKRSRFVVNVPAKIYGKRINGTEYQIDDTYIPAQSLQLPSIFADETLTQQQKVSRVKSAILKEFRKNRTFQGRTVIGEFSDEVMVLDKDRAWQISELRTSPDGEDTEAILNRPLGVLKQTKKKQYPLVPCYYDLCETALQVYDDNYCCPRQLGELLNEPWERIADEFDLILGGSGWRSVGITAKEMQAFCEKRGYGCVVFFQNKVLLKTKGEGKRTITFSVEGSHCYVYRNARRMLEKTGGASKKTILKRSYKQKPPPVGEFTRVEEGLFWAHDLHALRIQLLEEGWPLRVGLTSPHDYRSLKVHMGKDKWCEIVAQPVENEELGSYVQRLAELTGLKLEYRGEGLPSLTFRLFQELLQAKRRYAKPSEKKLLLAQPCAVCGEKGAIEIDHVCPVSRSFAGQAQCLQSLCFECHRQKTDSQTIPNENPLASVLNIDTYEFLCKSPKPKALVFESHSVGDEDCLLLDIRRCRRNCMAQSPYPIPIFSCIDCVQPYAGTIGDFNWIEKQVNFSCPQRLLSHLPFQGSGVYSRSATEFLLHYGIVKTSHIKYVLNASGHIAPELLKDALDKLAEAWGEKDIRSKRCINMCVGLMMGKKDFVYHMKTCSQPEDASMGDYYCRHQPEGTTLWDYIFKTEVCDGGVTTLPCWLTIMNQEAVFLASAYRKLLQIGVLPREIRQLCTDSLLFTPAKKRKAACLALNDLQYRDLKRPRGITPTAIHSSDSQDTPFRVEEVGKEKRLLGTHRMPIRDCNEFVLKDRTWRLVKEDEAEQIVLGGSGICLTGVAGTGKTFMAGRLIQSLRNAGQKVQVISKMHTASLLLGGVTANHFCFKHINFGAFHGDWLVIDELSQLDLHLWNQVQKLKHMGVKFLCLGDWNQFSCIGGHTWAGMQLPEDCVEKSNLLQILCDNNLLRLTEPRRSDTELFNYYSSLIEGGSRFQLPFDQILEEARRLFPAKPGFPELTLCISHKVRRAQNARMNKATAPARSIRIQSTDGPILMHPGLRLIACLNEKKLGCLNNAVYKVLTVGESVNLQCEISGQLREVPMAFIKEHMRLCFCRTIASIQGQTCSTSLRVITRHPRFTLKHLFVCSSRATSWENLEVV